MKNKNLLLSLIALSFVSITFIITSSGIFKTQKYIPRKDNIQKQQGIKGAMEYLASIRNNKITGEINPQDVLNARAQINKLANTKAAIGLNWAEVGPDNVGGRTRAILIDRNNPNIMYAGGVSGGLWKSTTGGTSWMPINDMAQNLAISCITQSPNGIIYVGTGEGFATVMGTANGSSGFIGQGIYKSTDGETFELLPSTKPTPNSASTQWAFVYELACDPVSERVYAATNSGLRVSDDNGTTWTNPVELSPGHPNNGKAYDVEVASDRSVLTCVNNKCYISPNGELGTFVKKDIPGATGIGRIEFAIAPTDPNYIYASAAKTTGEIKNIYRSTDKGETWEIIGPGGSSDFDIFRNQGTYDNEIVVFPNNRDKIIIGGIDMWEWHNGGTWTNKSLWFLEPTESHYIHADHHKYVFHPTNPDIIYTGSDGGVSQSIDGGETFHTMNKNYNTVQFYTVAYGGDGSVMGGTQDNGTILIDRKGNTPMNGEHIMGGDGGYCAFSLINPEVIFASIYYGEASRSPDLGDNFQDPYTIDSDGNKVAAFYSQRMINSNIEACFVTPVVFWESINDIHSTDSVTFADTTTSYAPGDTIIVRSSNNRYPFEYVLQSSLVSGDSIRIQDIVQTKFFLGISGGVWMTKQALDFSKTPEWYKISEFSGAVQTMSYSKDGNYLFVGTTSGRLYRISNLALSYDFLNSDVTSSSCVIETKLLKTFSYQAVTSIAIDPNDNEHIIVTLGNYGNNNYIYESTNVLDSLPVFSSKQGSGVNALPKMPVYASVIPMYHPNTVIVGTEYGVFTTQNINASYPTWAEDNEYMARVPVHMMRQQINNFPGITNYGAIYIGTHGRGIFECLDYTGIKEPDNPVTIAKSELKIYPNPVIDNMNIEYNLNKNSNIMINIYDMTGRIIKSIDLSNQPFGNHKFTIDCNFLRTGTYFVQLIAGKEKVSAKFIVFK